MAWCRDHIQRGAYALGPLAHDANANMGFVELIGARVEADAVVADFKTPGRLLLHIKPDLRSPGVLANVGQGFLNNVQHLDLQVR